VVAPDRPSRFTTKLLSKRTWADFEALFAPGTGWGRCGCLFALDARRATKGGTWADQRDTNLATMRDLVAAGRAYGVLVYDAGVPVGWCQFVGRDQLRFRDVADGGADWFLTCFVVEPSYRGRGATSVALRAALAAIARQGGGVVEGRATAMVPGPAPKAKRSDLYREGDVVFWGGQARARHGVEIDGVGPVTALYRTRRSMHSAPLGGTVDLYRQQGFDAVAVVPAGPNAVADRIVMRRSVEAANRP
jgi:GNAT superfamily N-acetyltransferase